MSIWISTKPAIFKNRFIESIHIELYNGKDIY